MRLRRVTAAALAGLSALACSGTDGQPNHKPRVGLFADPNVRLVTIGLLGDSIEAQLFSRIIDAEITAGGSHVVVLDEYPPFVRVFDMEGTVVSSFMGKGKGPGEAEHPYSLATLGDSLVLVFHDHRLSVFGFTGNLLSESSNLDFIPFAATEGCFGDWLLYGPQIAPGKPTVSWLHELNSALKRSGPPIYVDSTKPEIFRFGSARAFSSTGKRVFLYHDEARPPRVVSYECSSKRLSVFPLARQDARTTIRPVEGGGVGFVAKNQRFPAGAVATPGGMAWAIKMLPSSGTIGKTYITFLKFPKDTSSVLIPGSYELHDSEPLVGVLASSAEPVPHVFVVTWAAWALLEQSAFAR